MQRKRQRCRFFVSFDVAAVHNAVLHVHLLTIMWTKAFEKFGGDRMTKSDQTLDILVLLRARKRMTAKQLAQELEIHKKCWKTFICGK